MTKRFCDSCGKEIQQGKDYGYESYSAGNYRITLRIEQIDAPTAKIDLCNDCRVAIITTYVTKQTATKNGHVQDSSAGGTESKV